MGSVCWFYICISLYFGCVIAATVPAVSLEMSTFINGTTNASIENNRADCPKGDGDGNSHNGFFIVVVLLSLATVIGNLMVIMSVLIFRKLKRVSNLFIISLASADLIMGGVVTPMGAHYLLGSKWLLGPVACNLWTSIDVLSVTASICTLCAIAIDRYLAITKPFQYTKKVTRNTSRVVIGIVWMVSAAIAFIPINFGWWKTDDPCDLECYEDPYCCGFRPNKTYAVISSLISFYIPLVVMLFAYSIVFKIALAKRCSPQNERGDYKMVSKSGSRVFVITRREYKAVFTMGIIMGTFVICWLPFFIANITQVFCDRCISETTFFVLNWLGYANSFFNPLIYCHSKEFRGAFIRLILCSICKDGYQQACRSSLTAPYRSARVASLISFHDSSVQFSGFLNKNASIRNRTLNSNATENYDSEVNNTGL